MKTMDIEFEQYYCRTCNKLFKDIVRNPYYTRNNFCDNQVCIVYGLKQRHEMVQPNYHTQCPHCYSRHAVNVNDILTGKLIIKGRKLAKSNDKKMLECLGEWLKFYGEIDGYHIANNTIYNSNHRTKRRILRLLGKKSKLLNTTNNK